jgi:hypothetical protein
MTRAGTKGTETYFNNPEGNHSGDSLFHCPAAQREKFPVGPYDGGLRVHKQDWPPANLADEAERLFQAHAHARAAKTRGIIAWACFVAGFAVCRLERFERLNN